jgi:hypothetical protein
MMQPYLASIKRGIRQEGQATKQENTQTENLYNTLGGNLAALGDPYQAQMSGVQSDLTGNMTPLFAAMGDQVGGAPEAERAAAAGVVGGIGAGQQGILAGQRGAEAGFNTSAQRAGAEESMITQRNNLADFANFKQGAIQDRMDLMRQAPAQIDQLMTEIEQRNLNNRLGLGGLAIQRGQLGVSQGGLDLQRLMYETDQQGQNAIMGLLNDPDFIALLNSNPALAALFG